MVHSTLLLDEGIRNWVLLPLLFVMIVLSVLRHNVTKIMGGAGRPNPATMMQKKDLTSIRDTQILMRSTRFRTNGTLFHKSAWVARKNLFTTTLLKKEEKKKDEDPLAAFSNSPLSDPSQMMGMMKGNLAMVIPNLFMMSWVSHLFSGFVLVRMPIGLTDGFKTMFQRGIDLQTLDVSYVSSLSFYFLTLMGLKGVNSLLLGEHVIDDTQLMQNQMSPTTPTLGQAGPTAGPPDLVKIFLDEKENWDLVDYSWDLKEIEKRITAE